MIIFVFLSKCHANVFVDFGSELSGYLHNLGLQRDVLYYVSVKAMNGAGIDSKNVVTSKPIILVGEDIVGDVLDGRIVSILSTNHSSF